MRKYDELDYWHRSPKESINTDAMLTSEMGKKLLHAVEQKLKVEIVYSGGSDSLARRIIEPHKLYQRLDNDYVESYCYLRQDYRTFRIDRIESIEVLNSPHEKDSAPSIQHFPTYSSAPKSSKTRGIPSWLWIVGLLLVLYFCSKFR